MDEEAADARTAWLLGLQPLFGLLLVVLAAGIMGLVYLRYGREPKADYDRKYAQEPPTDDPPAVVGAIMDQRLSVGTKEFAATLFDLVRRGALKAEPRGGLLATPLQDLDTLDGVGLTCESVKVRIECRPDADSLAIVLKDSAEEPGSVEELIPDGDVRTYYSATGELVSIGADWRASELFDLGVCIRPCTRAACRRRRAPLTRAVRYTIGSLWDAQRRTATGHDGSSA